MQTYREAFNPSKVPRDIAVDGLINHYRFSSIDDLGECAGDYLALESGAPLVATHPNVEYLQNLGAKISDIAEATLTHRGQQVSNNRSLNINAAILTGDLPQIITNAIMVVAKAAFDTQTADVRKWTKRIEVKNFKPTVFSSVDVTQITKILKGGEYQATNILAGGESAQLETYGGIAEISRQLLVNNEMDVIAEGIRSLAVAVARIQANLVYGVLNDNSDLSDGIALFHAGHGNLLASTTLDLAGLGVAMAALRRQKTASNQETDAKAAYLLVNPDDEATALNLIASITAGTREPIEVISSSNLNTSAWYLSADPTVYPAVGRLALEGSRTPLDINPATRGKDFKTDGAGLKVQVDTGASALSYLGIVKCTPP